MFDEITRFVNWIRRRSPQAHTWRDYRSDLKQFAAIVGDCDPTDITYKEIDRFVTDQAAHGLKAVTINRRLAAVMSLFKYLSIENPDLVCPVLLQRHSLRTPRRLPRSVPEGDLHRFFAVIEDVRDKAIFLLMLRCGLRIAEVAALRLQDLYLREAPPRLLVRGKGIQERSVYLSGQAEKALLAYLDTRPGSLSEAVFLNYKGQGLAAIGIHKRLTGYRQAANVHLTAHQLRHNFANDLLAAGVPVTTIQKLMGHVWISTTQNYVAANDPQVKQDFFAAVEQLEGWQ